MASSYIFNKHHDYYLFLLINLFIYLLAPQLPCLFWLLDPFFPITTLQTLATLPSWLPSSSCSIHPAPLWIFYLPASPKGFQPSPPGSCLHSPGFTLSVPCHCHFMFPAVHCGPHLSCSSSTPKWANAKQPHTWLGSLLTTLLTVASLFLPAILFLCAFNISLLSQFNLASMELAGSEQIRATITCSCSFPGGSGTQSANTTSL